MGLKKKKVDNDITGFSISTTGCSYVFCTSEAFLYWKLKKKNLYREKIVWPLNVASSQPGLESGLFGGVKQFLVSASFSFFL